jgi:hypothetical protein
MNIKKGDIFTSKKASPGWTELEMLEDASDDSVVVEARPLLPLEFWNEEDTVLIRINKLEDIYQKQE